MTDHIPPEIDAINRDGFDIERFFQIARAVGHGKALGIAYDKSGPDWAQLTMEARDELVGVPADGIVASGAIVSLVDTCSGAAVWQKLDRFEPIATIDLRLDYLRPAFKGDTLVARCECYKMTKAIAFTRGIAHTGDPERPVAQVTGTFILRP